MSDSNGSAVKTAEPQSIQDRGDNAAFAPGSDVSSPLNAFYFPLVSAGAFDDMMSPFNPIYPNMRDRQLQRFSRAETMLQSAIYSMKSRLITMEWKVNGPDGPKEKAQELLKAPGFGDSLEVLIEKVTEDLLTADNGAFIEKIGPGNPASELPFNLVNGMAHLDSRQCWRTYDPTYPVIYTSPQTNKMHRIHHSRVVMMADNIQSAEIARNIGFCAVSRVAKWSRIMRDTLTYKDEKITGKFTRAIGVVTGVTQTAFQRALEENSEANDQRGFVMYNGIPFLIASGMEAGKDIDIAVQDLASIPDGFDFVQDTTTYAYILAWAFGVDAREFWPASQGGATKADAETQSLKAQRRGIGHITSLVQWGLRQCLPESVEFEFDTTDEGQELLQEDVKHKKLVNLSILVDKGAINPLEMRGLAIAEGIVDDAVLEDLDIPADQDTATTQGDDQALEGNTPDGQPSEPVVEDDDDDDDESTKALKKKAATFGGQVGNLMTGLYNEQISFSEFIIGMNNAIQTYWPQAWEGGMAKFGLSMEDISPEEQARLNQEMSKQFGFIGGLGDAVVAARNAEAGIASLIAQRVPLWENAWLSVFSIAAGMAAADKPAMWQLGSTKENCATCLFYEGMVYRMKTWVKWLEPAGLMPRQANGQNKECGGWLCDCDLVPTAQKPKKGKVPIWKGKAA